MKIDQEGLSPGVPGQARNDGKPDGSYVILTDTTPGGASRFDILWISPLDTTALDSLQPDEDGDHLWFFQPTVGVYGPIRIQLTHTAPDGKVTTEVRIFGIADPDGVIPPAPGERANPTVNRGNETDPTVLARSERNWPTEEFPAGNAYGWGFDLLKILGKSLATRRFIDVHVATERVLEYGVLGEEGSSQQLVATDNGALVIDGETLVVGDLVLLLWNEIRGVCIVQETGDVGSPWKMLTTFLHEYAESASVYRAEVGEEHGGRVFVTNRYGELGEMNRTLIPVVIDEDKTVGPGMLMIVVPDGDPIDITMRDLGNDLERYEGWRIAVKIQGTPPSSGQVTIIVPATHMIETDDDVEDEFAFDPVAGFYREWVFNSTLSSWIMVSRFEQSLGG